MYVLFCKSADDVTIRLSLRHHFWPRLKKTLEHNLYHNYGENTKIHFLAVKIEFSLCYVLFMHLINIMVNYLYRKYGVHMHIYTRKLARGTSHLKKKNSYVNII